MCLTMDNFKHAQQCLSHLYKPIKFEEALSPSLISTWSYLHFELSSISNLLNVKVREWVTGTVITHSHSILVGYWLGYPGVWKLPFSSVNVAPHSLDKKQKTKQKKPSKWNLPTSSQVFNDDWEYPFEKLKEPASCNLCLLSILWN